MDYSDKLRNSISKKHNLNLDNYVINLDLFNTFLKFKTDPTLETNISTIKQVYELGLNIGMCNLTSRYFAKAFDDAELIYGYCKILKGTKSCVEGKHVWIKYNDTYIDLTLKTQIPIEFAEKLGYTFKSSPHYDGARMLSEYNLFEHVYNERNSNIQEFEESILNVS